MTKSITNAQKKQEEKKTREENSRMSKSQTRTASQIRFRGSGVRKNERWKLERERARVPYHLSLSLAAGGCNTA